MHVRILRGTLLVSPLLVLTFGSRTAAADGATVQTSIDAAKNWLEGEVDEQGDSGVRSLAALALLKAKLPVDRPAVAAAIVAVLNRVQNGEYQPGAHHVYQAGVEATLLADADAAAYRPQIEAIVQYIVSHQLENGAWDYPNPRGGDTSVVQYACLGLWAGERAGIEIPQSAWDQAMLWHVNSQNTDGGMSYVPGGTEGHERGASSINMTLAGLSSMLIAARYSYPGRADSIAQLFGLSEEREETASNWVGPLEAVDLSVVRESMSPGGTTTEVAGTGTTVDIEQLKQFVDRAMAYTARRIGPRKGDTHYPVYYYYTMERMAALAGRKQIGSFDWFEGCSNDLIGRQEGDGRWQITQFPARDTSFAILFLTRATAQIIVEPVSQIRIGGGLLRGGRLPPGADLTEIRRDGTGLNVQARELGPLDEMLASLTNPGDVRIQELQRQIVERIQVGDADALIENKARLMELARYQNPDDREHAAEVRRTAVWALGRTNDLGMTRHLIDGLDDASFSVMRESRNALCWLARRPNGLGEANNPLESIPENASPDERQAAIDAWHAEAYRNWGTWYLQNRQYAERGDEFEARLLDRMGSL